jgi:hypothetical protein
LLTKVTVQPLLHWSAIFYIRILALWPDSFGNNLPNLVCIRWLYLIKVFLPGYCLLWKWTEMIHIHLFVENISKTNSQLQRISPNQVTLNAVESWKTGLSYWRFKLYGGPLVLNNLLCPAVWNFMCRCTPRYIYICICTYIHLN